MILYVHQEVVLTFQDEHLLYLELQINEAKVYINYDKTSLEKKTFKQLFMNFLSLIVIKAKTKTACTLAHMWTGLHVVQSTCGPVHM